MAIRAIINKQVDLQGSNHRTVFHEVLQGKLPASEKTEFKMLMDAGLFLGAGLETTAYALTVATFHIFNNPHVLRHLREELSTIWPDADGETVPAWNLIEKLPYMQAVIQETLRMSVGVTGRLARVNHHEDMQYADWVIPRGTPISMSQALTNFSSHLFPDPWRFDPTRWLRGDASKHLEEQLHPFSGGSRVCIAQQ